MNWAIVVNYKKVVCTIFGFVFLISGLIINFLQFASYILIKPFQKSLFRKINKYLSYTLFSQIMVLQQYWANVKVLLYCSKYDWSHYLGKESALIILNHSYEIDWLINWALSDHFGLLGNNKIFGKKSLQYVPTVGFAWKFGDSIFLERDWTKDKQCLKSKLNEITSYTDLVWLVLTPEGTRFTKEKHEASVEYAKRNGLPILKHHLTPRTKGFTATIPYIRNKIKAVYTVSMAVKESNVSPTFTSVLLGETISVQLFLERFRMDDLPDREAELSQWLHTLYKRKDDLVHSYLTTEHMSSQNFDTNKNNNYELKRRKLSAINFMFWAFFVLSWTIYILGKVILSGNIVYFVMTVAFFGSFIFVFEKLIEQSQVSKGSSYGIPKN